MLKKAKESGAEAVDPSSRPSGSSKPTAFVGSGFKLGSSESQPSEQVQGASKPKPPKQFIIKVYIKKHSILGSINGRRLVSVLSRINMIFSLIDVAKWIQHK